MARTEKIKVTYESLLCDGLRENNADGRVYDQGPDEPFRLVVNKVTETEVWDGRGRNWSAGNKVREEVATLTLDEAAELAKSLVNDIAYAAVVAERRVLIPEPNNSTSVQKS